MAKDRAKDPKRKFDTDALKNMGTALGFTRMGGGKRPEEAVNDAQEKSAVEYDAIGKRSPKDFRGKIGNAHVKVVKPAMDRELKNAKEEFRVKNFASGDAARRSASWDESQDIRTERPVIKIGKGSN